MRSLPEISDTTARRATAIAVFLCALVSYWLTVPPGVSFWDCPEYVITAVRLEVGHPPGNPFWSLFHRVATIISPAGKEAFVINLCSGLFSALAAMLLTGCIYIFMRGLLRVHSSGGKRIAHRKAILFCSLASLGGGLCFAWCDSVWYSAVEAEVYAMSIFLTALMLRLMLKWREMPQHTAPQRARAVRYLILIAYLTGLSIGVHQLNLLCIPALAVIYAYRRFPSSRAAGYAVKWMLFSFAAVACILCGMMTGTMTLASLADLLFVNSLHLPFFSGALTWLVLAFASVTATAAIAMRGRKTALLAVCGAVAIFLSGSFLFSAAIHWALPLSALLSVSAMLFLIRRKGVSAFRIGVMFIMLGMVMLGYSVYAIIPIRGCAAPPLDTGRPATMFAMRDYINREQYGSKPLLYGRTPYSKPVFIEETDSTGRHTYRRFMLDVDHPLYARRVEGGKTGPVSGMVTADDSAANLRAEKTGGDGYIITDYRFHARLTPELDMWLPRMTGGSPSDIDSYESWTGMNRETMDTVRVSEAVDSAGNFVGRINGSGKRERPLSYRPTYLQNLTMFVTYQTAYMYLRYLMWNFCGRQNDIFAGGETDRGNFITGFNAIDNAMLGAEDRLPPEAGKENRGRNTYFMIPFLLGIAGIIFLAFHGKEGRRIDTVILVFFLMTGLAIVVYLNQNPGEARERDYSFLGSYLAFCIWIAAGMTACFLGLGRLARKLKTKWVMPLCLIVSPGVPLLMLTQNYDDHDRSGRDVAADFAANILQSLDRDAILFVDGDNYTFPLWYAQEVEGVRRDVRIVNLAYLSLPDYIEGLMTPGEESSPVKTVATLPDIAYNRFVYLRLPEEDTLPPRELRDVLKELYSSSTPRPEMTARRVAFTAPSDTIILDLRKIAGGSLLRQQKLMMLDILASAVADGRPVYWMNALAGNHLCGMRPLAYRSLYALRFAPESGGRSPEHESDSVMARFARTRWGGFDSDKKPYADATVRRMLASWRASMTIAAEELERKGEPEKAFSIMEKTLSAIPPSAVPMINIADADSVFRETLRIPGLLRRISQTAADPDIRRKAAEAYSAIRAGAKKRREEWLRYHDALPKHLREVMSTDARSVISTEIND